MKRLKQKEKDSSVPSDCSKQFPDCPEIPNKSDCKTCPFFKDDNLHDGITGVRMKTNPLNKKNLTGDDLDSIMIEEEDDTEDEDNLTL
jgi:hypothetical protein